jgi:hypothetical protein
LSGQTITHFSADSSQFTEDLKRVFSGISDQEKKLIAPGLTDFIQKWNTNQFDPERKKIISFICNEMVRKKIRAYPYFFTYINTLNIFINTKQPETGFNPWSEILKKLIADKNSRKFLSFLESTRNLFAEGLVYKSLSTQWKLTEPVYFFFYDSVPSIGFSKSDLICYANKDSLIIYDTRGIYYPLSNIWKGHGGRVNWKRAGEDPSKVYADLNLYEIQMRHSTYTAESVSFLHARYFPSALLGQLVDKVLADVTEEKASYPRFYSYDKMIGIAHLFPNIDYIGGFALEGSRVIGAGNPERDARLFFKKNGQDFVTAHSRTFIIHPDRINSNNSSISIYHDNDSIFHPGLQLKYIDEKKSLSLTRDERVPNISPWFDSFHKVEIFCDAVNYKVGDPKINFEVIASMGKERKAVFESSNCYSQYRYDRLQGIDAVNPLNLISQYSAHQRSREITLEGLTEYMDKPIEQVEWILLNLGNRGFLVYDFETKVARIKNKLFNYVNARDAKADYDVISFNSTVTDAPNGILNLETFDLKIQGVPMVVLSDSQAVHIYPKDAEVVLKKDRDFKFTGKIEAGLFTFYVHDGSFEYSKFRLNLPFIDSMTFSIRDNKWDPVTRSYPLIKVRDAITQLGGVLQIDDSTNKSGLKALVEYPSFTNRNNSFVFWNRPNIQNGAYLKEKFFFELHPFTLKSLDIVNTDSLQFTGALTSAGIFPKIEEPLKVRPDFSLGLEKVTDTSGLTVYGGKGIFYSRIDLSDRGLRGDGSLTFLDSKTVSKDFIFLPESMKTLALNFKVTETRTPIEYPAVQADSVRQFWFPYKDSLLITTVGKNMAMYNNQVNFEGTLALSPRDLSGVGSVKISNAIMDSKDFEFKSRTFDGFISSFRIKSADQTDLTISTKNYASHFDLDRRIGEFKSNSGLSKVDFPFNKYICSIDRLEWQIDKGEVLLSNEESPLNIPDSLNYQQLIDQAYTGSEFISVHPKQDSLRFFTSKATYNLHEQVIHASGVKIIKMADAAIFPDSGNVTIRKNARMQNLNNAILIANTKSRYHQVNHATLSIASRKSYSGSGNYEYKTRTGEFETITFDRIEVDTTGQTVAYGSIPDSSNFLISPEFAYKGKVVLNAGEKNLMFDGSFRAITDCLPYKPEWIKFSSIIDPLQVQIPISLPLKNAANETTNLGLVFSNAEGRIGPAFFKRKKSFSDSTMITSSGLIEYDQTKKEFRIAEAGKLKNPGEKGNYVSLNTRNCTMRGDGNLNLGLNPGNMKMETFGTIDYFIIPDSTRIHIAIALNFPFSDQALLRFNTLLESVNLTGLNILQTPYATAMESLLGKEELERLRSEADLTGKYKKFPDALDRTIFLADVWMKWDTLSRSYVSYGPIGIGNIGKTAVNRYVNGTIEFIKKRKDDDFTLYMQLTPDEWFFFNYRSNLMQAISSDLNFNDILTAAAQSKAEMSRVNKEAKGYRYSIATDRKKRDFLRKFESEEN